MTTRKQPYVLGLDSGVGSLGYGVLALDRNDQPCGVLAAGVRGFNSGIPNMRDYRKGTETLSNEERRTSRSQRRRIRRRSGRHTTVYQILQEAGLLPKPASNSRQDRHFCLQALDKELAEHFPNLDKHEKAHILPYHLRAKALREPLLVYALGRALYHLAQRRGFRGSLKSEPEKEDKKKGEVSVEISKLEADMKVAGGNTLAEYFVSDYFQNRGERIRDRWTSRVMYRHEFEEIWKAQQSHHPCLTDALKNRLEKAMFFQRPTRAPSVGKCSLERGRRRAPIACLEFQRFRWRQMLNNLRVIHPCRENPDLTEQEYNILAARLEADGDIQFSEARVLLGLDKPKGYRFGYKFNFELDEEDTLIGNRTAARLREVLGECWTAMKPEDQQRLVEEILSFDNEEALVRRLQKQEVFGFDAETAQRVAKVRLERGYCSLSRKAIRKLLPFLEQKQPLAEAKQEAGYKSNGTGRVFDTLPPVRKHYPDIRNPVVLRTLSQLRTVVNHCIREFGKPAIIRLELARDLKHSRKRREKMSRQNWANRKDRKRIVEKILKEIPGYKDGVPSHTDILKIQLAEECGWTCPYTGGESISMPKLLVNSEFQIEHIFPRRYGDDSFANKTLCRVTANAEKRDRTPFGAFGKDPKRWHEIISRVKHFGGKYKKEKLRRFLAEDVPEDFISRQLNDTAYAAKLTGDYLGLLYAGQVDASGKRRVQVSPGRATRHLREVWQLEGILHNPKLRDFIRSDDQDRKNRYDHRHHAVDAIVIAMTDAGKVAMLGEAAQRAEERGTRLRVEMEPMPQELIGRIQKSINGINVSWKSNRRLRGRLHKDLPFKAPSEVDSSEKAVANTTRISLESITDEKQIDTIVDKRIRELVRAKFLQHKGESNRPPFGSVDNHPYFETKKTRRRVFVHRVTVEAEKGTTIVSIGKGVRRRWVNPAVANHHMKIWAILDKNGKEKKWDAETVSLMEAVKQLQAKKRQTKETADCLRNREIPKRLIDEYGSETTFRFKFSLALDEYMELDDGKRLVRVVGISGKKVEFRLHTDARPNKLMRDKEKGGRAGLSLSADSLRKAKARKVVVDPLGNILPAHD